jgi:hypothetical protein
MKLAKGVLVGMVLGVTLATTSCAGAADDTLASRCEDAATEKLAANMSDADIESTVGTSQQRDEEEVEAYDMTGTSVVQNSGRTVNWEWDCFGQRVDGEDFVAIQSIHQS